MSTYENEMLVTYRYCLCFVDFMHIISCDGPAERSQTVRLSAWGRLPAGTPYGASKRDYRCHRCQRRSNRSPRLQAIDCSSAPATGGSYSWVSVRKMRSVDEPKSPNYLGFYSLPCRKASLLIDYTNYS